LELLIRANLSTAGALRYLDKTMSHIAAALLARVNQCFHRPLIFLSQEKFKMRKQEKEDYLSARLSPDGIPLQRVISMLS
jgi:hypothetical protein